MAALQRITTALLVLLLTPSLALAYQGKRIDVSLLAEHSTAQPGQTTWLGVLFEPDDHWHVYWQNPGDSGIAPKIEWQLPEGVSAGDIHWPFPEAIPLQGVMNYGYHRALLMVPITLSEAVHVDQSLSLKAKISWLVCDDEQCLPGKTQLQLTLPVSQRAPVASAAGQEFVTAREHLPASGIERASYTVRGDQVVVTATLPARRLGNFTAFPVTTDLVDNLQTPQLSRQDNQLRIQFTVSDYLNQAPAKFEFVLVDEQGRALGGTAKQQK